MWIWEPAGSVLGTVDDLSKQKKSEFLPLTPTATLFSEKSSRMLKRSERFACRLPNTAAEHRSLPIWFAEWSLRSQSRQRVGQFSRSRCGSKNGPGSENVVDRSLMVTDGLVRDLSGIRDLILAATWECHCCLAMDGDCSVLCSTQSHRLSNIGCMRREGKIRGIDEIRPRGLLGFLAVRPLDR